MKKLNMNLFYVSIIAYGIVVTAQIWQFIEYAKRPTPESIYFMLLFFIIIGVGIYIKANKIKFY